MTPDPAAIAGAPLIVTAVLDAASTAGFERLRRRHFPPERLVVGAHVTMFHRLPADRELAVRTALAEGAARHPPLPAPINGPRSLGRGVAFDLDCPALDAIRRVLAEQWRDLLTPRTARGTGPTSRCRTR